MTFGVKKILFPLRVSCEEERLVEVHQLDVSGRYDGPLDLGWVARCQWLIEEHETCWLL